MAAGIFTDVPDLRLLCDGIKRAGWHMLYLWTFTGTHAGTGRTLRITGCEEWELDKELQLAASRGGFVPEEWSRQTAA